jgi:hypothetical protein
MFLSDDQILCLNILPYYDNIHSICESDIEHLKQSNIIDKNKIELFNILMNHEKNNIKSCKFCNEEFQLITELKKHIVINCFYNELNNRENKNKNNNNNNSNNIITSNNCNNTLNNNINTLNNNNNNINIYLEIKTPLPFDSDWDISKINESNKERIIFSKYMYTELLEEILKNDINLNVIIDKEKDLGMVYKNDIDQYIQMKLKDIIENTMRKLNNHLIDINENDTRSFDEIIKFSRQMINKKHIDFQNNSNISETVKNCMSEIYETKKNDAKNIAKNIITKNNLIKKGY